MPDNTGKNETMLTDKINELESLLNGQTEQAATSDFRPAEFRSGVPILDDLFEQEDYADYPEGPQTGAAGPRLEQIAGELESKLSHELDEIVSLLKTNMKESILNELQTLLKDDARKKSGT